jgi:hypothetical protein
LQVAAAGGHSGLPNEELKTAKKSRHADPIDDVPALFEAYQASGGIVPLGVLVAEVEALQQAATRLEAGAAACSVQLQQLEERGKLHLIKERRATLQLAQERLRQQMASARASEQELRSRYGSFRDAGVARFVPLLLQTVAKVRYRRPNLGLNTGPVRAT